MLMHTCIHTHTHQSPRQSPRERQEEKDSSEEETFKHIHIHTHTNHHGSLDVSVKRKRTALKTVPKKKLLNQNMQHHVLSHSIHVTLARVGIAGSR